MIQVVRVAYEPEINQRSARSRSRKLASFQKTLKPPVLHGDDEGDLLLIGWGSTEGAIDEAVDAARAQGLSVSSMHLRFLFPLPPGLPEIFNRFKKVLTVEINYSDDLNDPIITPDNRRLAQLAWYLRAQTRCNIDCYSNVYGQPMNPGNVLDMIESELSGNESANGSN